MPTKFEPISPDKVRPSDYATPVAGGHPETKVLAVRDNGICLVVDGALTGLLPKNDYTYRRRHDR